MAVYSRRGFLYLLCFNTSRVYDEKHDFKNRWMLLRCEQKKKSKAIETTHRVMDVCRPWLGSVSKIEFILAPINFFVHED